VGRSRVLGAIGALFGVVAIVMGLLSALGLATVANAFPGYVSALFASGFLGWAALRTGILTHSMAWTLIIIAIATVPMLVVTPLPIGPDWATDALAFLLGGIGYTVVGMRMLPLGHTATRGTRMVASRVAV
jgi:hypothetical protein